ncbi:hypothetical protein D4R89_01020 [bacterium]|nr:MAG: hypothetical protein D4R89_01020 [bacterium]
MTAGLDEIKGRPVKVTSSGETLTGIAVDIDSDGDLQGLRFCPQGRGSRTVNVLPKPGSLVTPMAPLWALRIFWTMDNPSPVPFIFFSSPRWT